VTGARAAAMHGQVRDPEVAARRHPRAFPLPEPDEARELTLAATAPVAAIGGGAATAILLAHGGGSAIARARAWSRLGDAPLDFVEQRLAVVR
jgi:hypothetical protein